jgi:putative DNA primase/helicase
VFSSSTPLPLDANSAFSVYTHYNHGGDYSAAAKELVRQGYGEKPKKTNSTCENAEPVIKEQKKCRIKIIDALDFMAMTFPPRENIMAPWLPSQGLTMIYALRGIGKTHLSLEIAYSVASGGKLFTWDVPRPKGVLFIDGEMPGAVLKERLARIVVSSDCEPQAPLRIITPDLQTNGMLDLSRVEDQAEIEPYLEGISLIIIDNISTLCRTGRENEAESWLPVQEWALGQRASGRSVLFIHHSGKGGNQRGTSRREDVLDTVIALRHPGDYSPDQGATFEVHFDKARGIYGEDTKPFEARLTTTEEGRQEWITKSLEQSTAEKVAQLLGDGIPQKEIAELIGITKGAVSKAKKRAEALGLLK